MTGRCQDAVPLLGTHLDGELDSQDARWVQEHLDGCAACAARRSLLAAQGSALRRSLAARADQADFSSFSARVMARVAADQKAQRAGLLDRAGVWLRELFGAHRLAFGAGAGLSAAAALTLVVGLRVVSLHSGGAVGLASSAQRAHAQAGGEQADEAEIEDLEVYGQEGMVLQAPGQSTLIWVTDEQAPSGSAR